MPIQSTVEVDLPVPTVDQICVDGSPSETRSFAPKVNHIIYGSFWIDQTEFALPVSVVQEVVNEPTAISEMPLSPPFMLGLFNLRGKIIPVIDLRILLEYGPNVSRSCRKVAIFEHGNLSIGLIFDKTGEVLSDKGAARVDFCSNESGVKDVVVEGLLKLKNGDRIVQLLDPYEILKIEKIPHADYATDTAATTIATGQRLNCLSFQFGHTSCAIDLRYVEEVKEMPPVDESILAYGSVIGTANLRNTILPIVDFRNFMGDDASHQSSTFSLTERKLLVFETGAGPIGLMIFSIDSIIPYFENDILPFSKLALPRNDIVKGCLVNKQEDIVMLLDQEALKNDPVLLSAAKSCRSVYPEEEMESGTSQNSQAGHRRTFILFTFDKCFALDTAKVSEVINRPKQLLEPPYALHFVEGIIRLRGELITLINPRLLYGLPNVDKTDQKVLIFNNEGQKYGILVDSVDEIAVTTEKDISELKPMDYQNTSRSVAEDVTGCLHVRSDEGGLSSVMILDVGSLLLRCLNIP